MPSSLAVAWRVLRTEGLRATADRATERWREALRRRSFRPAPAGWRPPAPIPVLLLAATPPAPRLGGVQVQLLARLAAEPPGTPYALLYPEQGSWRLEVDTGRQRQAVTWPRRGPSPPAPLPSPTQAPAGRGETRNQTLQVFLPSPGEGRGELGEGPGVRAPFGVPVTLEDSAFEAAVLAAAELTGARALQVEGLAGFPFASLLRLRDTGLRQILCLHDFAAFCPRPHLLEQPDLRFCNYCRDLDRCGRCLAQSWPVDGALQGERRRLAASLLAGADALVFASEFLLRQHSELFPDLPRERSRVIPPAGGGPPLPPRAPGPLRHVALVSGFQAHKGAQVFAETVRLLAGEGLRWTVYGGVDPRMAGMLRGLPGVRVRGSFAGPRLPSLLRRDAVDLALLPSIVPESYSLALGECVRAGVPVLAFALGALADRVPQLDAGRLVSLEAGAAGLAAAIRDMLRDGRAPSVPAESASRIDSPAAIAAAHRRLHAELGLLRERV